SFICFVPFAQLLWKKTKIPPLPINHHLDTIEAAHLQFMFVVIQETKLFFWGANASRSEFRDLVQHAEDNASKKAGSPHSFYLFHINISL
ncbi:hypothetical protein H5410_063545, partial [Solanum commersonii]